MLSGDIALQLVVLEDLRSAEFEPVADQRAIIEQCYSCIHRRSVTGNEHIECVKPDRNMTGAPHGIRQGWFYYPILFDPVWMTRVCANHEKPNPPIQESE